MYSISMNEQDRTFVENGIVRISDSQYGEYLRSQNEYGSSDRCYFDKEKKIFLMRTVVHNLTSQTDSLVVQNFGVKPIPFDALIYSEVDNYLTVQIHNLLKIAFNTQNGVLRSAVLKNTEINTETKSLLTSDGRKVSFDQRINYIEKGYVVRIMEKYTEYEISFSDWTSAPGETSDFVLNLPKKIKNHNQLIHNLKNTQGLGSLLWLNAFRDLGVHLEMRKDANE